MSKLKLTKIITVTPFFLVVNQSSKALRYMEENKQTDLWFDLSIGQVSKKKGTLIFLFSDRSRGWTGAVVSVGTMDQGVSGSRPGRVAVY